MNHTTLLQALAQQPHTIQQLTTRLGVSTSAVTTALDTLQAEGVELAHSPQGHRLLAASNAFGAATLQWRCERRVHYFESCDSTNHHARQCVQAGERHALVVANHQRAGRGRRGREWDSPAGKNLLFSLVLHPPVLPEQAPRCVLLWAAAMANVLGVSLKWPNDLVCADGQKVGGILAELELVGSRVEAVILGVGINVNQETFPPALSHATSLHNLRGAPQDRAALLAELVSAIEQVDVTADLSAWRRHARTLGQRVRVGDVEGVATDIREDGALMVGDVAVLTGDVSFVSTNNGGE